MINLKDNIWIEGFDDRFDCAIAGYNGNVLLYEGKTSEIPKEIAKECVEQIGEWFIGNTPIYQNYIDENNIPVMKRHVILNSKQSIQSACEKEYCIIYKK